MQIKLITNLCQLLFGLHKTNSGTLSWSNAVHITICPTCLIHILWQLLYSLCSCSLAYLCEAKKEADSPNCLDCLVHVLGHHLPTGLARALRGYSGVGLGGPNAAWCTDDGTILPHTAGKLTVNVVIM